MARTLMPAFAPRYERSYAYDPKVDNQEVEQFGFIHLAESFEKGIVPGGIDLTDESFNGVENPGTLMSRSDDVFCGLRKAQYVRMQLDKLNSEQREKAEKALQQNADKVTMQVSSEG